jgi:hypothetical protein
MPWRQDASPDNSGDVCAGNAYCGDHFDQAVGAKGGTPRIVAKGMGVQKLGCKFVSLPSLTIGSDASTSPPLPIDRQAESGKCTKIGAIDNSPLTAAVKDPDP